jgi:predicted DNA-binding transcriptional regulator YafY|tara:strand:- start:659 stop:880 length:222 start_codon:yes stop_codon:yes gene_type:complete
MKKEEYNTEETYFLVYRNEDDQIKTYEIGKPDLKVSFGNAKENRGNIGFKAYCLGREEVRSFRHDRIVSLAKA